MNTRPAEIRFEEKIVRIPMAGCWIWTACCKAGGYGKFGYRGQSVLAHRFSYELHRGPIAEGLQLDHLCRTPSCVNPYHLEAVTPAENVRRSDAGKATSARHKAITHCPQGHPYTEGNVFLDAGGRRCRICSRTKALARHHKKRRGA